MGKSEFDLVREILIHVEALFMTKGGYSHAHKPPLSAKTFNFPQRRARHAWVPPSS